MSRRLQDTNISEEQVIVTFHSFLQGALAQAHVERLLDASILSSAEADIQIQGPSICLFLAALRSEGSPPNIATSVLRLNADNCPPSFRNWFLLWADCVPRIKALPGELRNDLARIICDQEPQSQPIDIDIPVLAQNLRAIAIEISQRRTFQERFNQDLDYALKYGRGSDSPAQTPSTAQFQPPPAYDDDSASSPTRDAGQRVHALAAPSLPSHPNSAPAAIPLHRPSRPPPNRPIPDHPALRIIRETLYASLADVLYSTPSIFGILSSKDSSDGALARAYFAAVCLAILDVSLTLVDPAGRQVQVVNLGSGSPSVLRLEDFPVHLQPLAAQLLLVASSTQTLAHDDNEAAIELAGAAEDAFPAGKPVTKIDRLRTELEHGTNWEAGLEAEEQAGRSPSPLGTVRVAANRINALALRMSQMASFREREEALFQVLVPSLCERQGLNKNKR